MDIHLGGLVNVTDEAVLKIGEYLPNLEILGLDNMNITDLGMEKVITNCSKLRDLCLRKVNTTDKTLDLLGDHCKDMKDLEVTGCVRVTEAGVRDFVQQGSKPLKLVVEDVKGNSLDYLSKLRKEYPRLILVKCVTRSQCYLYYFYARALRASYEHPLQTQLQLKLLAVPLSPPRRNHRNKSRCNWRLMENL